MKVLLVEGAPGLGSAAEAELVAAGHAVVGCEPADPSSPCRGLEPAGECPLDGGDIDVAVVSRAGGDLAPSERGALCAARSRIPVVITGNPRHAISFGPGTHLAASDLTAAVESAARSGLAHVAAVRRELLIAGVVTPEDVVGDEPPVAFEVERDPSRLRLVIRTHADDERLPNIVKAAAQALRHFDQRMPVIDVATESW